MGFFILISIIFYSILSGAAAPFVADVVFSTRIYGRSILDVICGKK